MPLSEAPTIVNRPGGVQESSLHRPFGAPPPLKEATLARRKAMQDALVQRLVKKFASNDRVKRQLVAGEVHEFFEKAGYGAKLGPADLQRLEANVRAAVAAADPNATDSFLADRAHKNELQMVRSHDIRTVDLQPGTIADLQGVANWNAVSKYRAGFNKTAQLQEEEKRQAGVEAMRVNLAHQRSHMAAMKRAKAEERAREQAASERLQAEYKADMEREKAKADEKARHTPAPYARQPPAARPRPLRHPNPAPFPPPRRSAWSRRRAPSRSASGRRGGRSSSGSKNWRSASSSGCSPRSNRRALAPPPPSRSLERHRPVLWPPQTSHAPHAHVYTGGAPEAD